MKFNFKNWRHFFKKQDSQNEETFEVDELKNSEDNLTLKKKTNLKKLVFIILVGISFISVLKIFKVSDQSKQKTQQSNEEKIAITTAQKAIDGIDIHPALKRHGVDVKNKKVEKRAYLKKP